MKKNIAPINTIFKHNRNHPRRLFKKKEKKNESLRRFFSVGGIKIKENKRNLRYSTT